MKSYRRKKKFKTGLMISFILLLFCNDDLNKFVLSLRKGVYPYEHMDSWEKFDETSIPPKEAYYSN